MMLQDGTVAMIDALGWKGIWRRHEVAAILRKVEELRAAGTRAQEVGGLASVSVLFLSDTIVISCEAPRDLPARVDASLVASTVSAICMIASTGDVPLIYRGSIASGEFLVRGTTIVGPAIDKAARLMDVPKAALVWIDPDVDLSLDATPGLFFEHDVPTATFGFIPTRVVNPLRFAVTQADKDTVCKNMLSCFDDSDLSVVQKRIETERYLRAAMSV